MENTANIYPTLRVELIQTPNRLYAIPIFGGLFKFIILIPIIIELYVLFFAMLVMIITNPFYVLFTGKYWDSAYQFFLGYMRFWTKLTFFLYGLTNKYPGFSLNIDDTFSVDIAMPQTPNKLFAIPLLGGLARGILLIPFTIFFYIIQYAANIGVILLAWAVVLFKGKYPESVFELIRDTTRLGLSSGCYFLGLSDKYPSFSISWNHKGIKIFLIILAIIVIILSFIPDSAVPSTY